MRKIALLGSTGSIGTQALDIVRAHSDLFEAYLLTANDNADLLIRQAREFAPDSVVIANADKYDYVSEALICPSRFMPVPMPFATSLPQVRSILS